MAVKYIGLFLLLCRCSPYVDESIRATEMRMIKEHQGLYQAHINQDCCGDEKLCPKVEYIPFKDPSDKIRTWQTYRQVITQNDKCKFGNRINP